MSPLLKTAAAVASRRFFSSTRSAASGSSGTVPSAGAYKNIQSLQTKWLADESIFVWQKCGARDSIPYYATLVLCAAGTGYGIYQILRMSFPQKKN